MKIKLIISLLLICLAFSLGLAQAQMQGDNTSQNMSQNASQNMSQNMSQQGNMSGNMSNVPFMLQSIEGVRNNDITGEKWFTYINGTQVNRDFGLNNVSNGTNLSFWYANSTGGRVAVENASYVVNITVNVIPLAGNQTGNQTNGNQTGNNQTGGMLPAGNQSAGNMTGGNQTSQNLTVLYNNTVNLTQGNFTFMPENSTQTYQVDNLTDLGALNATGLAFNASLMENMTGNMAQNQNMTGNMSQNQSMAGNMTTGNTTQNMSQNMTGNMAGDMNQNMTGKTTEVSIKNFAFNPGSVTISRGDTVRWTNMDSTAHTVTSMNFDSGRLEPGNSFEFTFTDPGTVEYHCSIHPAIMQGNVTVMAE
jgi:plastocyanin